MILPLRSARTRWALDWVAVTEPAKLEEQIVLPVCVFVVSDQGNNHILETEMLVEIDQRRLENLIARLVDQHGPPDHIAIADRGDWDASLWQQFEKDFRCPVRLFQKADPHRPPLLAALAKDKKEMARQLTEPSCRAAAALTPVEVAAALVDSARRIYTPQIRRKHLNKAIELDSECALALVELADLDYSEVRHSDALTHYQRAALVEQTRLSGTSPDWWADSSTRTLMRAMFGQLLSQWNSGKLEDAIRIAEDLLDMNPTDNQGIRFMLPMLYQLIEDHETAATLYAGYEKNFPNDYVEPSLWFGWGLSLSLDDDEAAAAIKYRRAMLANLYIAPMMLDLPEPPHDLWHPNDRAEPGYAQEFCDAFAILWERDQTALRTLRDVHEQIRPELEELIQLRQRMADYQDQRYDPHHKARWKQLKAEEFQLIGEHPDSDH